MKFSKCMIYVPIQKANTSEHPNLSNAILTSYYPWDVVSINDALEGNLNLLEYDEIGGVDIDTTYNNYKG